MGCPALHNQYQGYGAGDQHGHKHRQTNRATTGVNYTSDGGGVPFRILGDGTAYANGDSFAFSTFVSAYKGNAITEGQINVHDGP